MMTAFQEGCLPAGEEIRSGGRQTVVVQHVSVKDGGKAVVAAHIAATPPGDPRNDGRTKDAGCCASRFPQRGGALKIIEASQAGDALRELADIVAHVKSRPAMAEQLKPKGWLERFYRASAAAAHCLAMRFSRPGRCLGQARPSEFLQGNSQLAQISNVESARLAMSAARLMMAVNDAALALDRLRNGGRSK